MDTTNNTHHHIKKMDARMASLITAGEVIQRPVFAVKELIENALDAGAIVITIEVEAGGIELIKVTDNGCGIAKDDLVLALERHATSKIESISDLDTIATLGFRGEALASMDAASELTLASRTRESDSGWQAFRDSKLKVEAGKQPPVTLIPAAHPLGTTVILRRLFAHVPPRRRFLCSERTEFKHIDDVVKKLSLSRFNVRFSLKHNGRLIRDFSIANTQAEKAKRVAKLMSDDFIKEAEFIDIKTKKMCLWGWVARPTFSRRARDLQYFYINGRCVKGRLLNNAVNKAYADILHSDRQPAFVLYLEMDPAQVDVNVHPTKQEVRFQDSQLIHSFLFQSIKQVLGNIRPADQIRKMEESTFLSTATLPTQPSMSQHNQSVREIFPTNDFAKQLYKKTSKAQTRQPEPASLNVTSHFEEDDLWKPAVDFKKPLSKPNLAEQETEDKKTIALGYAIGQIKGAFILAENSLGLVIVDMHAAHERIVYEKLKAAYHRPEGIQSQTLLIPITLSLTENEADWIERNQPLLSSLGLSIDRLSSEKINVRSIPSLLEKEAAIKDLIHQLLPALVKCHGQAEFKAHINEILANMACKRAIKANQILSLSEMNALLRDMENTPNIGHCSHGRPTWHQITMSELNAFFLRGR